MAVILIVENDLYHQQWLTEDLMDEGYRVLTAVSGREALATTQHNHPDIIVLDIVMPDMDGGEVLERLLRIRPHPPIIIHTGHASYRENYLMWGADAYVVKSSDTSLLKREIARALGV